MKPNVHAINIDVGSTKSVNNAFDIIESSHGFIDILVNNAGISQLKSFEDLEDEDWINMLSINLMVHFVAQEILIKMRKNKYGKIINISSVEVSGRSSSGSLCCFQSRSNKSYKINCKEIF